MNKIKIILLLLPFYFLQAKDIQFMEKRYISQLNNETIKYGKIDLKKDSISLNYKNSDETIIYTNENITVQTKDTKETYEYGQMVEYDFFFSLVQGVYKNNFEKLYNDFTPKNENNILFLFPKENVASIFNKIEIKKDKKQVLEYIIISFTNGDKVYFKEI